MVVKITVAIKDTPTMEPIGHDRHGAMWSAHQVRNLIAKEISDGTHFKRRIKTIMTDFQNVTDTCANATLAMHKAIDDMVQTQTKLADAAKKTSGSIRGSANDIKEGLERIERSANFDKMTNYVVLLERMAVAMATLADIERTGKLERIVDAIK